MNFMLFLGGFLRESKGVKGFSHLFVSNPRALKNLTFTLTQAQNGLPLREKKNPTRSHQQNYPEKNGKGRLVLQSQETENERQTPFYEKEKVEKERERVREETRQHFLRPLQFSFFFAFSISLFFLFPLYGVWVGMGYEWDGWLAFRLCLGLMIFSKRFCIFLHFSF